MSSATAAGDLLPPGVGRVPAWWMECTPHYTLDVEDEVAREMAEDQMAFYYMQLAAADDAGLLGPDGKPKLDEFGRSIQFAGLGGWGGRNKNDSGSSQAGPISFGGRTFKSGQAVIDPSLFGVLKSDPNYHSYLTGAKLPPGYFEKMDEYVKDQKMVGNPYGILNNDKQTAYGRYGRQAETPTFQPSWIKKKLRKTTNGDAARSGLYDDSPNKFVEAPSGGGSRRIEPASDSFDVLRQKSFRKSEIVAAAVAEPVVEPKALSYYCEEKQISSAKLQPATPPKPSVEKHEQESTVEIISSIVTVVDDDGVERRKRIVKKVRRIKKKDTVVETPPLADTPPPDAIDEKNKLELLQRRKAELLALQQKATEEQRLRDLQDQKEKLLVQKRHVEELAATQERAKEEAEHAAAAEAFRKKKAEKLRLLQLQAAAEEAEVQRKQQEKEEDNLRKLQLEKMKLLQLKKAQEEAERLQNQQEEEKAAELARKMLQLEQMKLLQLQRAKEEAERMQKQQQQQQQDDAHTEEARRKAKLEQMKQMQLQSAKTKAEEERIAAQSRNTLLVGTVDSDDDDDIAAKIRRLEELKEMKRQQDLADNAGAIMTTTTTTTTTTTEQPFDEGTYYEEETYITGEEETIEEIVEEEDGTIEEIIDDDDEEYTLAEETYIEDQSITDLHAILAAKQAELARLQA